MCDNCIERRIAQMDTIATVALTRRCSKCLARRCAAPALHSRRATSVCGAEQFRAGIHANRYRIARSVANTDILRSGLGLLVQGKSDFDTIENFRGDAYFKQALGIKLLPSSPTLRQRMDARAADLFDFLSPLTEKLLVTARPDYGVLPCGWLPLDVDTCAMDNGGSAKDGVGRTYAGVDGYCPLATYLGSHGYCLELALRPGVQHSALETQFNFERVIPMAQRLSAAGPKAPILARLDSGFDSAALMREIEAHNRTGLPRCTG